MTTQPQLEAELSEQISRFRRQIAAVPVSHRTYSARATEQLERLAAPSGLDLRARLEAVRQARLELSDGIRFGTSSAILPRAPRPE